MWLKRSIYIYHQSRNVTFKWNAYTLDYVFFFWFVFKVLIIFFSGCTCYLFFCSLQAKFLFMVRDGRATVHSIISRKVTITGFDLSSYRQCMQKWNHAIEVMHEQCRDIGKDRCMMVSESPGHPATQSPSHPVVRCSHAHLATMPFGHHAIHPSQSTMINLVGVLQSGTGN